MVAHCGCPMRVLLSFNLSIGNRQNLSFTARIERPPLYRGGSASKKDSLACSLSHPSEGACFGSAGPARVPFQPCRSCALCEQEGRVGAPDSLHFLKINLGSVIFPIETATNSHPLAPNSFSLICIFSVSGSTSTILYWYRLDSCSFATNGCPMRNKNPNAPRPTPAINHATEKRRFCMPHPPLFSATDAPLAGSCQSPRQLVLENSSKSPQEPADQNFGFARKP